MANFKKGGGNKPQKYNLENGQYIDGDDYIDNFDGNEYIFPESDFHSEDYASFYLTNCFNCKIKDVSDNKINNYLLTYKTKNDKSRLLSFMGYNLNTSKLLKKDLIENTNFDSVVLSTFYNKTYTFAAKTKLVNYNNNGNAVYFKTIWQIDARNKAHFVTLMPWKEI